MNKIIQNSNVITVQNVKITDTNRYIFARFHFKCDHTRTCYFLEGLKRIEKKLTIRLPALVKAHILAFTDSNDKIIDWATAQGYCGLRPYFQDLTKILSVNQIGHYLLNKYQSSYELEMIKSCCQFFDLYLKFNRRQEAFALEKHLNLYIKIIMAFLKRVHFRHGVVMSELYDSIENNKKWGQLFNCDIEKELDIYEKMKARLAKALNKSEERVGVCCHITYYTNLDLRFPNRLFDFICYMNQSDSLYRPFKLLTNLNKSELNTYYDDLKNDVQKNKSLLR